MSILRDVYTVGGGDALKNYFDVIISEIPGDDLDDYKASNNNKERLTKQINENIGGKDVSFRAKSVSIPSYEVQTTDIDFYTSKIKVPVSKLVFDPVITIVFRIDRNWAIYQTLMRWRDRIFDPASGYVHFDSPNPIWLGLNDGFIRSLGLAFVGRCKDIQIVTYTQIANITSKTEIYQIGIGATRHDKKTVVTSRDAKEYPVRRWRFTGAYPTKVEGVEFDHSSGDPQTVSISFAYLDMFEYCDYDERSI